MCRITFKGKVQRIVRPDDLADVDAIRVPQIERHHCDMHAFRASRKFGGYANSDLFKNVLYRALREIGITPGRFLHLDRLPTGVTVDTSGFLAVVTITLEAS